MKKRLLSVIMAVAMLEGNWMQVNAEEVNLLQEAVYSLEEGYAAYYNTAMASGKQSKSISDYVYRKYLSLQRRDIYEELESYIDKEQSLVLSAI